MQATDQYHIVAPLASEPSQVNCMEVNRKSIFISGLHSKCKQETDNKRGRETQTTHTNQQTQTYIYIMEPHSFPILAKNKNNCDIKQQNDGGNVRKYLSKKRMKRFLSSSLWRIKNFLLTFLINL